ncbi:hypothetical protein C8R43DRAFT_953703 [Mycena crocata]|nr:hypothetical protein C8R43DRAFT_953703 [Mycena crocata]
MASWVLPSFPPHCTSPFLSFLCHALPFFKAFRLLRLRLKDQDQEKSKIDSAQATLSLLSFRVAMLCSIMINLPVASEFRTANQFLLSTFNKPSFNKSKVLDASNHKLQFFESPQPLHPQMPSDSVFQVSLLATGYTRLQDAVTLETTQRPFLVNYLSLFKL